MSVLDILKQSSTGMTREELAKKCQDCEVTRWLPELQKLIDKGLVKIDKEPAPARFKVTNAVWE